MTAEWIVVGYPVCPYCNGQGCPRCGNDGETAVYEWVERDPEPAGAPQVTGLEVLTDLCAGGPDPDSLNSITVRGMASGAMHIELLAPSRDAITAWEQHLGLVQGSELLLSSGRLHVTRWARIARGGRPVNVHLSGTVQQ